MKIPLYQVDAFTTKPFKGNPAAVVLLNQEREKAWMQSVANEMDLSETAFLLPKGEGYELRWFTPKMEVELCGHATLASAHILYELGYFEQEETIKFFTKSGLITSTFNRGTIELAMPRRNASPVQASDQLIEVVGCTPLRAAQFSDKLVIAELESRELVEQYQPDYDRIARLPYTDLVITAVDDRKKYDFVSRFFSPRTYVFEDPVTGMAHCSLGPFYMDKLGKEQFHAYQASPRGGELWIRVAPDKVYIGGKAVTVFLGDLLKQED